MLSRLTGGESPCQPSSAHGRLVCTAGPELLFQERRCLYTCRNTFQVERPCVFSDLLFSLLMVTLWILGT